MTAPMIRHDTDSRLFDRALADAGCPPHEETVAEIGRRITAHLTDFVRWQLKREGQRESKGTQATA